MKIVIEKTSLMKETVKAIHYEIEMIKNEIDNAYLNNDYMTVTDYEEILNEKIEYLSKLKKRKAKKNRLLQQSKMSKN